MTILIAGFEPFDNQKVNASWEAVSKLPAEIEGQQIVVIQVPVEYWTAPVIILREIVKDASISDVIIVGEAGGRTRISVEMIGVNYDDTPLADNKGNIRENAKIDADGPDGVFATLPVKFIVQHLLGSQIPAQVSWSAGQYVCNHTLYSVVNGLRNIEARRHVRAGFVHVPWTNSEAVERNGPGLPTEELTRAVHEIASYIAQNNNNRSNSKWTGQEMNKGNF